MQNHLRLLIFEHKYFLTDEKKNTSKSHDYSVAKLVARVRGKVCTLRVFRNDLDSYIFYEHKSQRTIITS